MYGNGTKNNLSVTLFHFQWKIDFDRHTVFKSDKNSFRIWRKLMWIITHAFADLFNIYVELLMHILCEVLKSTSNNFEPKMQIRLCEWAYKFDYYWQKLNYNKP